MKLTTAGNILTSCLKEYRRGEITGNEKAVIAGITKGHARGTADSGGRIQLLLTHSPLRAQLGKQILVPLFSHTQYPAGTSH